MTGRPRFQFDPSERWVGDREAVEFTLLLAPDAPGGAAEQVTCRVTAEAIEDKAGIGSDFAPDLAHWRTLILDAFHRHRPSTFEPVVAAKLAAGAWHEEDGGKVILITAMDIQ